MKKLIKLIKKLFLKFNYIFYVGSSDILPPPLDREIELKYIELSQNGDIEARNTAFSKATTSGSPTATSNAVGILLHDVDVTNGNENGVIVLFGFVDLDKLDEDVFELITAEVKTALAGKVTFLTGSGTKRTAE